MRIDNLFNILKISDYESYINKFSELMGKFIFYICHEENDDFILFNKNNLTIDNDKLSEEELEEKYRDQIFDLIRPNYEVIHRNYFTQIPSFILSKTTMEVLAIFETPLKTNTDAIYELKKEKILNIKVIELIEGFNVIAYYHNDKWNVSTEYSLDGNNIKCRNNSMKDLFIETIKTFDALEKDKIYHYILNHHKNYGLISTNHYGSGNKELKLTRITKKNDPYNLIFENETEINTNNIDDIVTNLNKISHEDLINKKLSKVGYRIYKQLEKEILIYDIQTPIYHQISNLLPKNMNMYQGFLELYQNNKLKEYISYFTNYPHEIVNRLNQSLRTISKEILNIYHATRKKQNKEIYDELPETFKRVLYNIHGIYIDTRKTNFDEGKEINKLNSLSISFHDIYYYLKSISFIQLRDIFFERKILIENKKMREYMCIDCMYTVTQTKLMENN
jgi:hypothetical protein